jgi:hypothetical protein
MIMSCDRGTTLASCSTELIEMVYIFIGQVFELLILLANLDSFSVLFFLPFDKLLFNLSLFLLFFQKIIQLILVQLFHRHLRLLLAVRLQVGASALGFGEELLVGRFAKIVEGCWWLVGDHVVVKDAIHWFANGIEISSGFELIRLMGCYIVISQSVLEITHSFYFIQLFYSFQIVNQHFSQVSLHFFESYDLSYFVLLFAPAFISSIILNCPDAFSPSLTFSACHKRPYTPQKAASYPQTPSCALYLKFPVQSPHTSR